MSTPHGKRPRVLVLTQVYHPEPNFITAEVAESLAADSDVTVVTGHPNYPWGRFYPGTRFLRITKSSMNGVTVWRVPFYPDHSLSAFRRAVSCLSFAMSASLVAPFVAGRPDTVWVYHGPFTTGLASLFFKFFYRSRIVFTCADLWPESFGASGMVKSRVILSIASFYNRTLNKAADLIVCATRGTLRHFREDGIRPERLLMIPVWVAQTEELGARLPEANPDALNIVYTGNLGPSQSLHTVILAAAILQKEGSPVCFDIYGTGASEAALRALASQTQATNVTFHGLVTVAEAFGASARALAQIISLQPSPLFSGTIPSKLFSAFAAGTPILYGLQGESAELTEASGAGIAYASDDPQSLVSAIKTLLAIPPAERLEMRSRLRRYFSENFDPAELKARYARILQPLSPGPAARFDPDFDGV